MSKKIRNSQSKSFYIEIIIAIVFLSIVAAVVMLVYSRTNHIIYVNELKDEATNLSRSYIECLKSGMKVKEAIDEVFIGNGYVVEEYLEEGEKHEIEIKNDDVICNITLNEIKGECGIYTEINMKYSCYFGDLYDIDASVYESSNEKEGVGSDEKEQ
ncbi:MAG: type II secretion system protein [Lachnospiraceae bacterium]|nr:type II secretion system protein [Lachnospiraceae bacterium]